MKGGSYTKDKKTGKLTLVERTAPAKVEQPKAEKQPEKKDVK